MKEIIQYFKPYGRRMVLLGLLYMISTLCSLFMPYLMSDIVTNGIAGGDMAYIYAIGGVMLGLAALALLCGVFTTKINAKVATGATNALQQAVFNKINSLTFEEYSSIGTSSLLTRSTHDVFEMREAANGVVYAIATVPVLFIGGTVLSLSKDWVLALVMAAIIPIVLFIVWLVTRQMGALWEKADLFIDVQNKVVRERLSGLRVIRAFDKENREHGRIEDATLAMAKNLIKSNVLSGVINPLSIFLLNIATVVMLYLGAVRMQTSSLLTAGDIIATIQYVALIMNGLLVLSWTIAWLPHLKVCVKRIGEVLKMEGLAADQATGQILTGEVYLNDVTFAFPGADAPAISHVTMNIQPGEVVSIIGGTGCGKSAIAKLLLRFYTPTEGNISLGGKDYETLSRADIRANISIALQKSMIFQGTVSENIRMGKKDASSEEVAEAVRIAQIEDFISSQKEGLEYELSQAGANLSGGQKQRINIARTILKDAAVYVFDDSFSALDYLTESKLRKELNRRLAGKTQIIITQRAATAMRSDKVFVMDNGALVGVGTHEALLKSCSVYKEICDSQLGARNEAI